MQECETGKANRKGSKRRRAREHFLRTFFIAAALLFALCAAAVFFADPFFHYHAPWFGLKAVQSDKEYQVPGALDHLTYDSLIVGSSVAENNDNSWYDESFDCTAIKAIRSYGATADLCWFLDRADETHPNLKYVFYNIDPSSLHGIPETMFAASGCPMYLYDRNPFNDVEYLFNRTVLFEKIPYMIVKSARGYDEAKSYNWWETKTFSEEAARSHFEIPEETAEEAPGDADKDRLTANIALIKAQVTAHPDTQYYFFFPPYSVLWWDYTYRTGDLAKTLYEEKACMEELLAFDNVKLFSFQADPDIVCNLDNYMDGLHFRPEINHQMCDAMAEGRYQILSDQDIDACLDGIRSNIRSFEESEQQ